MAIKENTGSVGIGAIHPYAKLQVQSANGNGTGSISSSGTTVTGTGTIFSSELQVGDEITIAGIGITSQTRSITSITSNASLTTDTAFDPALSSASFQYSRSRFIVEQGGNVGIGKTNPGSKLSVVGLPTSATGLTSGDIWRDAANGNVLKIVP